MKAWEGIIKRSFELIGIDNRRVKEPSLSTGDETGGSAGELPAHINADVIIDVGVAGGTPWLYERFPHAKLVLIEPLNVVESLSNNLQDRDYTMFECAAGSANGQIEINYDLQRPSLSSVHERTPLTARDHIIEKKIVEVRPIDDIMEEVGDGQSPVGLKIDTEGFEFEVLKGAARTLSRCTFVVCEVSIAKRFFGSYEFSELVSWMYNNGFFVSKVLHFAVDENSVIRMADMLFEPNSRKS